MRQIKRKTRLKRNILRGWLLGFTLTAFFGVMGLGLAAWQEDLQVGGTVHTGDIAPYFQEVQALGHLSARGEMFLHIIGDEGQQISITIRDAHPDDVYGFEYYISNEGSVPVSLDLVYESSAAGLTVENTLPQGVLERGDTATGEFTIRVDDNVEKSSPYAFDIELIFKQWNMVH